MKKIIALTLAFVLLFSLCSCGKNDEISALQSKIEKLEKENKEIKKQSPDYEDKKDTEEIGDLQVDKKSNGKTKPVSLNTPFNVGDVMTITLTSNKWEEEIYPSNTSGVYSYYDDVEGEKFFVIRGELKNLASNTVDISDSSRGEIKINNKYTLPVTLKLEKTDGTNFNGEAKPLQTLKLIAYASVSDELYETCETIDVTLNIVNDDASLTSYYSDSLPKDSFSISFTK